MLISILELLTETYASGDLIQFNLTSSNADGERAFAGQLVCDFLDEEVYNASLPLDVGQTMSDVVEVYARPGVVRMFTRWRSESID